MNVLNLIVKRITELELILLRLEHESSITTVMKKKKRLYKDIKNVKIQLNLNQRIYYVLIGNISC